MIFEEKQISSQLIYEGKILNVRRDKVTAKKGESTREIVEHNGAVPWSLSRMRTMSFW